MSNITFRILKTDSKTRARLGVLKTPHGTVRTPAYVIVATHAKIRALEPADIKKTKTQLVISNTYHLWDKVPKEAPNSKHQILNKSQAPKNLITKTLGETLPTMTDSGGFQVFSFGAAKEHGVGKVLKQPVFRHLPTSKIKITEKGVYFKVDGKQRFLSPELSIAIQEKIGADIIFAFDECTSPLHPFDYNRKAMERTNRWAVRCLKAKKRKDQILYGIVQGGRFNRLRAQSAKFIGSLPFGGFGIGGSFGKEEMVKTLASVIPHLPDDKPRHLLGIGRIHDVFSAVESGVDTFDCVIPTREARHARIWTSTGPYNIRKSKYHASKSLIERGCACPVCKKKTTRGELHELFRGKKAGLPAVAQRAKAGRLATMHNIWFFNRLLENIRNAIEKGRFVEYKKSYLSKLAKTGTAATAK